MQGRGFSIVGARRLYPGPWIAPTWIRDPATGLWSNAPVPGVEIISDPGFADTTNWAEGIGWSVIGGVAVRTAPNAYGICSNITGTNGVLGNWYLLGLDVNIINAGIFYVSPSDSGLGLTATTTGSKLAVYRATSTGKPFMAAGVDTDGTIDNFSCKLLTLSQIIAYRDYGRQVSISSAFTLITNIPGGVVSRLSVNPDGTFNFVHCWHNGTNLRLDTIVNSYTVVSKVNAAAAYGAGRIVKINFSAANTAQAFYNGTQVGADQDISAVPPGTYAGLFLPGTGMLGDPIIT